MLVYNWNFLHLRSHAAQAFCQIFSRKDAQENEMGYSFGLREMLYEVMKFWSLFLIPDQQVKRLKHKLYVRAKKKLFGPYIMSKFLHLGFTLICTFFLKEVLFHFFFFPKILISQVNNVVRGCSSYKNQTIFFRPYYWVYTLINHYINITLRMS